MELESMQPRRFSAARASSSLERTLLQLAVSQLLPGSLNLSPKETRKREKALSSWQERVAHCNLLMSFAALTSLPALPSSPGS